MKIALASAPFRNGDLAYNLQQMQRYMACAREQGAQLVCFGEAFLQGFSAFSWNYEKDRNVAVSVTDPVFETLLAYTEQWKVDLLFGFLEREGETLYSSCALIGDGKLLHLYRRVSKGWKEFWHTDEHYQEGSEVKLFDYRGKKCLIALCGDLWDETAQQFAQGADLLFWPLYINYTPEEWNGGEQEAYTLKAQEYCRDVLMINCVDAQETEESPALGGCYRFTDGHVAAAWPLGSEGMLVVEVV